MRLNIDIMTENMKNIKKKFIKINNNLLIEENLVHSFLIIINIMGN